MNPERLYKRRTWTVVALFAFVVLVYFGGTVDAVAPSRSGVARELRLKSGADVLVDSANGRGFVYSCDGSTVGTGTELQYVNAKSVWLWDSMGVGDVVMIYHYDDHHALKCVDSLHIMGNACPDTFITRTQAISDDVIRGYHIDEGDVWPQHFNSDSTYTIKIGASSVVNVSALPAAVILESEWEALFDEYLDDSLEAGTYDAYFDSLTADSSYLLDAVIDTARVDSALYVEGDAVFSGGIDINLPADDNIVVDGRTIPHTTTIGAMLWEHTPAVSGTRAITLNIDMDGYSDTHGMVTEYIATGMVAGDVGMPIEVDIDKANSTGGHIHALQVSETGTGTVDVAAVGVYSGVDPIHQHSGSDANVEHAWNYNGAYADITAAFASAAIDSQLFVANGDLVFAGNAAVFDEIKFTLAVEASGAGIKPTFDYSTGVGTWSAFGPSDGTNGFRQNGDIAWESDDLAGWVSVAVNGETKYWIRITRTRAVISTPPTEDIVQSVSDTDYEWDANGDVSIRNLDVGGTGTFAAIVYPAGLITDAAVAWGAGGDSIDADDVEASATRLWVPASGGSARIMVSDGSDVWQSVNPAGDVEVGPTGATLIQTNVIDAERLESADNPAVGDIPAAAAADAWTFQSPKERDFFMLTDIDSTTSGEYIDYAAIVTVIYKVGVTVGDQLLCFPIGTPGFSTGIEKYAHCWAGSSRVNDSLDVFKPWTVAADGNDRMGYLILKGWPWNGPNDPK